MANWEDIKTGAVRAASKTIKKTGELAEITSMHLKLTALNAKRDGMFEKLGRLTYKQLKSGESQAEAIAPVVDTIDKLGVQITKQKAKIETAKLERAKAKEEAKDNTNSQ